MTKYIKYDTVKAEFNNKIYLNYMEIYKRTLIQHIKTWLARPEIITIIGPRQVGKTFLVSQILPKITNKSIEYFNFEDLETRELFVNNPKEFVNNIKNKEIIYIFDEFQKVPKITNFLKVRYDQAKNCLPKIFLTGSSSFQIQDHISQSLVGQTVVFNLFSLSLAERHNLETIKLISDTNHLGIKAIREKIFFQQNIFINYFHQYLLYGGYPELGELGQKQKSDKLKLIIQTILEKDLLSLTKSEYLFSAKKLLEILAFRISHLISFENLASETGLNIKAIRHLSSILEGLFFLEFVYPKANFGNEYKKAPKVYFHDPGLRNALLKITTLPQDSVRLSDLVENFIFNQLKRFTVYDQDYKINYWQDYNKNEVDFILSQGDQLISIEVKYQKGRTNKISTGVANFIKKYKPLYHIMATYDYWGEEIVEGCHIYYLPCYIFGLLV